MVGDLVDAVVGDVGDPDPGVGRRPDIDDVVADARPDEEARSAQRRDLGAPERQQPDDRGRSVGSLRRGLCARRSLGQDLDVDTARAERLDARLQQRLRVGDHDPLLDLVHRGLVTLSDDGSASIVDCRQCTLPLSGGAVEGLPARRRGGSRREPSRAADRRTAT